MEEESFLNELRAFQEEVDRDINDPDKLVIRNFSEKKFDNLTNELKKLGIVYEDALILQDKRENESEELPRTILLPADTPSRLAQRVRLHLENTTGEQGFRILVKQR